MNIGIVGAGLIGSSLARLCARAGHSVLLSFSRSTDKLNALAAEIGPLVQVGTPAEAVQFGEIVVLSVHFEAMDTAIAQMGDMTGKVIVDTNNPFDIKLPAGMTAAQEVLRRLPHVRLVKAFNTLYYVELVSKSIALCG
jgi:8-hydroxy-5-deazaflavin:NADPH oxidoreductase